MARTCPLAGDPQLSPTSPPSSAVRLREYSAHEVRFDRRRRLFVSQPPQPDYGSELSYGAVGSPLDDISAYMRGELSAASGYRWGADAV